MAFVDILGFSSLTGRKTEDPLGPAGVVFSFFENCVLPYRESMKEAFAREVPTHITGTEYAFKSANVWSRGVPEGTVNFVYLSDSVIFYSNSITHLFREVSAIYGCAITYAVPIRAGIAIGDLHHSEWAERPGTAICLFGDGLTRAVEQEKSVSGSGMRIWLTPEVSALASTCSLSDLIVPAHGKTPAELKWWLAAYRPGSWGTESQEMERQFGRWFTEKHTKNWFSGPNCEDTKSVVAKAIQELQELKR